MGRRRFDDYDEDEWKEDHSQADKKKPRKEDRRRRQTEEDSPFPADRKPRRTDTD